ncbi:hypothetical protein [Paraburkholderia sediminicola]|uniref:hypothetical protein n=1 Tax=Paraburkholderia sediminicola TaxID=458836 RepID=UPI0038BBFC9E
MNAPEFFFTDLDENRRPKGSRDPLGLEQIWSQVGRRMVGNLTTVTRHLDNFIIALTGFAVAAQGPQEREYTDTRSPEFYLRFERFEQLAAWARYVHERDGVIGRRMLGERNSERTGGPVEVGSGAAARILGDQRRSGLWGLYSSALVGTGLIDAKRALTADGHVLCKSFLECYQSPAMETFREAMSATEKSVQVNPDMLVIDALLDCVGREALGYRLLIEGGGRLQKDLWEFALANPLGHIEGPRELIAHLARTGEGVSGELHDYAQKVERLERVLVVVATAFSDLMGRSRKTLAEVAEAFRLKHWGDREAWVYLEIPQFGASFSPAWTQRIGLLTEVVAHLRNAKIELFIETLLEFHAQVMKERGGPAWVSLDAERYVRVIMGEGRVLKTPAELEGRWDNDYFLGAFVSLWKQTYRPGKRVE